jgi:uncharacterized membrane protein YphA (DoxX/SURF4 family)
VGSARRYRKEPVCHGVLRLVAVGGFLLLVGLLTRVTAVPLMIVMMRSSPQRPTRSIRSSPLLGFEALSYFVMFAWLAIAGAGSLG